ncbi:MAG: 8-amino-7-oxononanoate synthase [Proteobacteria bacterium]|nr:8-amino-7-oxononanoate synthase [Pseudomonadota bacterium]
MNTTQWQRRLKSLADRHLERHMRIVDSPVGPVISTEDGQKLCFCSNDYLGLANHPQIKQAMADAALNWGASASSSRLVAGNTSAHERLEKELCNYLGTAEAIIFPSGYQANVGAIFALTEPGDAIFSDALVHASLVDGCRLSRADVHIFRHRDTAHLQELLSSNRSTGLKLIITDTVFSMDGDLAPLKEIGDIAAQHSAQIYLDEAHALGVIGPNGQGLAAKAGLQDQVAVRIGTFGKALGTFGAFVATGKSAAGLIRSRARGLLYTTAAPACLIEATRVGLEIVKRADVERAALRHNIEHFVRRANELDIPVLESDTAIQPVVVGEAEKVMTASRQLWERGLFIQGMRPPTVPEGTSRLRITINASHQPEHIEALIKGLAEVL